MANENLIEKDQIALDEPKAKKKSKKELKKEAKLAKEAEKQAKKDAKKNKKSKSQTAEVVDDKNPKKGRKKKKKSCCCRACCTMVIISLVLIVAGSAVGCYFGNQLLVENFGVKITEVFSVLGGVKNSSDRKIVKNKFSAKDYEAAEDSLKSAIFLKEDAEFSLDTLMELAIDSAIGTSDSGAKFASAQSEGENQESTESGNAIIEYVKSALTYENIDIEKLKGYDASKIDDYKFNLTDKQLASILQRALEKILTSDMVYDELNASFAEMGIDAEQLSIEKMFAINQVAFNNVDGISSVKLTACFKLYKFLGKVLDNLDYSQLMGDPSIAKYGKIGAKVIKPLFAVLLPVYFFLAKHIYTQILRRRSAKTEPQYRRYSRQQAFF